jgi:hypothetical protein
MGLAAGVAVVADGHSLPHCLLLQTFVVFVVVWRCFIDSIVSYHCRM